MSKKIVSCHRLGVPEFIDTLTNLSSVYGRGTISVLRPYGDADTAWVYVRLMVPLVRIHDNYKNYRLQ